MQHISHQHMWINTGTRSKTKMKSFKWQRYSINPEDYKTMMGFYEKSAEKSNELKTLENSKLAKAYETASRIREFEIKLFWKRATFFWAFIVAIYTAYYHVLTKFYERKCCGETVYCHGSFPLLILSALGLFFCFSWLLSSIGSKHWQENWEMHLDLLENEVTGPLYKTYEAGKAYSESKITIAAGWVVTVCSYGLLIYEFSQMLIYKVKLDSLLHVFYIALAFAVIIAVFLYAYSVLMIGNTSNTGEVKFQTKVYEGIKYD